MILKPLALASKSKVEYVEKIKMTSFKDKRMKV